MKKPKIIQNPDKPRRRCIFVGDQTWAAIGEVSKKQGLARASWIRQHLIAALPE